MKRMRINRGPSCSRGVSFFRAAISRSGAGIGFLALFVLLAGATFAADEGAGGTYRAPLASEPNSLDPAYITGTYAVNVAMNLFDGLVEFDESLNVVPAIAKRWIISRDHCTYSFYLQKGVKFHNGREVTAEDFVYSFSRLLHPDTKSPMAQLFMTIKGAKDYNEGKADHVEGLATPDPYTLTIVLDEPFAPFLSILATANAKVVPKECVGPDFGTHPVGTGPFSLDHWEQGKEIVLKANPGYFGGRPHIDELLFRVYQNDPWGEIFDDFQKGNLEHAVIPRDKYDEVMADASYLKKYQMLSSPGLNLVYVGMNQTVAPLDDYRVRRAMSKAVDTQAIVRQITKSGAIPANGILPPGLAGYDPEYAGHSYDPAEARTLLAEAGHPDGEGIPPLEIWTVSKSDSVRRELEAYKQYLAEVGIEIVPKVAEDWKSFVSRINEKKAPLFYAAWYADYPDPDNFLYVLAYSKSSTNRMAYRNARVDRMLDEARRETDYTKRVESYREIQRLVMEEAPIICQHINSFHCLAQPYVKDISIGYLGPAYISYDNIWLAKGDEGKPKDAAQP